VKELLTVILTGHVDGAVRQEGVILGVLQNKFLCEKKV
jgi:hypothetical protein